MQDCKFQLKPKHDQTTWDKVPVFIGSFESNEEALEFGRLIQTLFDIQVKVETPDG